MDTRIAELQAVRLPDDDGVITRAFAELGQKMADWARAARGEGSAREKPKEKGERTERAGVAPDGGGGRPAAFAGVSAAGCSPASGKDSLAACGRGFGRVVAAGAPSPAESAARRIARDEDEALLGMLEPELAKAVMVRRRLTNDERRVKDLLDDIRREQAATAERPAKRQAWWSKGNR